MAFCPWQKKRPLVILHHMLLGFMIQAMFSSKKVFSYKIARQMITHCDLDFFKPFMIQKYIFVGLILCLYISQKIQKTHLKNMISVYIYYSLLYMYYINDLCYWCVEFHQSWLCWKKMVLKNNVSKSNFKYISISRGWQHFKGRFCFLKMTSFS